MEENRKFEERPGKGRKMKSTIRQDRALVRLSLSNRRLTSSDLCQEWRQSTGVEVRDGAHNKKCIRMLRCVRKPCPHAAPHRIQTQLSSRCTSLHRKLNIL